MKTCKKIAVSILAGAMGIVSAGCGVGPNASVNGDINIMVYSAGYGFGWLEEAIRIYEEDHPDVKIGYDGDSLAFETIKTKLDNGTCEYDIVLADSGFYDQFVANGALTSLDDVYDSLIPDSDKKVGDVVNAQIKNAATIGGHIYGIPWQQNTGSGLVYNVEMFKQYGWDENLPTTMDELWELCERIDSDTNGKVAPITYGGSDGNGYLNYNLPQWLCEYYGYDEMIEFLKADSLECFSKQEAGRTKVYETLAELTKGEMKSGRPRCLKGSEGALAITAQTNFVNGEAAMTICGPWLPTEMKPYTDLTHFECGYLPMPHINADKMNGDHTIDTSDVRFSTDGNYMAIPSTSKNIDLAKDFLLYMFTKKSYTSFVKANNGLIRPVQGIDVDTSEFDGFTKAAYQYFSNGGEAKTVYQVSPNRVFEKGTLAIFQAYRGSFFSVIMNKTNYSDAIAAAKGCFANEIGVLAAKWDAEKQTWN